MAWTFLFSKAYLNATHPLVAREKKNKKFLTRIRTRVLQITASEILPLRQVATDELSM